MHVAGAQLKCNGERGKPAAERIRSLWPSVMEKETHHLPLGIHSRTNAWLMGSRRGEEKKKTMKGGNTTQHLC